MPAAPDGTRISSVLGTPRDGMARHSFRGGNFFVLAMLNRYRRELGVVAQPQELEMAAHRSVALLQTETATVSVERAERSGDRLAVDVLVQNATGHKLPTGFPSRRAWLHVAIRDRAGRVVFESGALGTDGRIAGNDNDTDPLRFEPHFTEISRTDDVEIYEAIIGDAAGAVTTGLLSGTRYLKDNRLLPRGFDKATAHADIAVVGDAARGRRFRKRRRSRALFSQRGRSGRALPDRGQSPLSDGELPVGQESRSLPGDGNEAIRGLLRRDG